MSKIKNFNQQLADQHWAKGNADNNVNVLNLDAASGGYTFYYASRPFYSPTRRGYILQQLYHPVSKCSQIG
jgi:hypothetical protein